MIKALVPVGGRGKAGGVRIATSAAQAEVEAEAVLSKTIKGFKVRAVLVEECLDIEKELYVGMIVDRQQGCVSILVSPEGGVDIEETSRTRPHLIYRHEVDPLGKLRKFEARRLAAEMGLGGRLLVKVGDVLYKLYNLAVALDATTAEINPLVITKSGDVVAADAVLNIDNDSLFRHANLVQSDHAPSEMTQLEKEAADAGFSLVSLDGDIGVVGSGAGITMATLDLISFYGGEAANFLDIGGGITPEKMAKAMRLVMSVPGLKSFLINIFGGMNRCDLIAEGIVGVLNDSTACVPLAIRLSGTNEEEGRRILRKANLEVHSDLESAIEEAVRAAKGVGA